MGIWKKYTPYNAPHTVEAKNKEFGSQPTVVRTDENGNFVDSSLREKIPAIVNGSGWTFGKTTHTALLWDMELAPWYRAYQVEERLWLVWL